jgi:pyruvate dehydrogenase E1 component beta subunit/2-oxoisovalerate dehydrogenase E1 component
MLYNMTGKIAASAGAVDIDRAAVRRAGRDVTVIAWSYSLWKALEAAEALAKDGIEAEVVDLRSLRPLDEATLVASISRTRRAVVVDEGWRTGSLSAEIAARVQDACFWHLDAPVARVCSVEVPVPYPKHLETAALPQVSDIIAAVKAQRGGGR